MVRYSNSPMAAHGGRSPMSDAFAGYSADSRITVTVSTETQPSSSAADTKTEAPIEPVEIEKPPPQQTAEADIDQLADVTYELDDEGRIVDGSVQMPSDVEDVATPPAPTKSSVSSKPATRSTKKPKK